MTDFARQIGNNPLAVKLGATTVNVTKIQEIDDPIGDSFKVVLVSGVTAFGKLEQYPEAMSKFLRYLNLQFMKLQETLSAEEQPLCPVTLHNPSHLL